MWKGIWEFRDSRETYYRRIWYQKYWNISEKIKIEKVNTKKQSEISIENDTKVKDEKTEIENHREKKTVKEKHCAKVPQSEFPDYTKILMSKFIVKIINSNQVSENKRQTIYWWIITLRVQWKMMKLRLWRI